MDDGYLWILPAVAHADHHTKQIPCVIADDFFPAKVHYQEIHASQVAVANLLSHLVPLCFGAYRWISDFPASFSTGPRGHGIHAKCAVRVRESDRPLDGSLRGIWSRRVRFRIFLVDGGVVPEQRHRRGNSAGASDHLAALRDPSCQHCTQLALLRRCPGRVLSGIFRRPGLECGQAECGERDYGLDAPGVAKTHA